MHYSELSLRPYPGKIKLFRDLAQFRAYYEAKSGKPYEYMTDPRGGQFIRLDAPAENDVVWLVYGKRPHVLAHEFVHILFHLFEKIGAHPADSNGEPFCYMLSQLMLDAR